MTSLPRLLAATLAATVFAATLVAATNTMNAPPDNLDGHLTVFATDDCCATDLAWVHGLHAAGVDITTVDLADAAGAHLLEQLTAATSVPPVTSDHLPVVVGGDARVWTVAGDPQVRDDIEAALAGHSPALNVNATHEPWTATGLAEPSPTEPAGDEAPAAALAALGVIGAAATWALSAAVSAAHRRRPQRASADPQGAEGDAGRRDADAA